MTTDQKKNLMKFQTSSDNLPAIPTAEALATARTSLPHYGMVPRERRVQWLSFEILKYYRLSHMQAADTTPDAVALDDMMMDDPIICDLTQPEIDEAFRKGIFGKYGKYYGVTAISLYSFLESFIESEKKKTATAIINQQRLDKRNKARKEREEKESMALRQEIEKAKKEGTFTPQYKMPEIGKPVKAFEPDYAHQEKVRQQAKAILSGELKI